MPSWTEILREISVGHDAIRRKYLKALSEKTGRNIIAYYSGWLQKDQLAVQGVFDFGINDEDKSGFMAAVYQMDRSKGLDLILHTPGGQMAATESLVDYLRSRFGTNIRAIIPQIAMSAGTLIALACKEIVMGTHSSLGPFDPQVSGVSAHGVLEEFERACRDVTEDSRLIPIWQPIIAKYNPTLVGECEKASKWAEDLVRTWLASGMFSDETDTRGRTEKIDRVIQELGEHSWTLSHARHISASKASEIGLRIYELEADNELQDLVLSVHHAFILTFSGTAAVKIIENQEGKAFVKQVRQSLVAMPG